MNQSKPPRYNFEPIKLIYNSWTFPKKYIRGLKEELWKMTGLVQWWQLKSLEKKAPWGNKKGPLFSKKETKNFKIFIPIYDASTTYTDNNLYFEVQIFRKGTIRSEKETLCVKNQILFEKSLKGTKDRSRNLSPQGWDGWIGWTFFKYIRIPSKKNCELNIKC